MLVLVAGLGACSGRGAAPAPSTLPAPSAGSPPIPSPSSPPAPPVTPPFAQLTCAPCTNIAFTSSRDGNPEIYSVSADGTGLTRLTDTPAADDQAVWSPDGRRIAFTSDYALVVMDADGSNVVRHALPHDVWHPTWSPDGSRITYSAVSEGSANIWTVDVDGGWPALVFSDRGFEGYPAWSPDGTKLALVSDWFAYDFTLDVFLVDADGAGLWALTDGNIVDRLDYVWPSWSPNGARIGLTQHYRIGIDPNGADRYTASVGVINRDGTELTRLIAAAPWSRTSWSPDGTMIAFTSDSGGTLDVSWVKVDGSARGTIITNGWNASWQR